MTYEAIAGGWALSVSAMAAGDSAGLSCGGETFARVFADEKGVHAAVTTRWDGARKRFGSDEPLVFTLDAPSQWGDARLEWRVSGVRLYVENVLCDEDWPLGGFPMDGGWTLESSRPAVLEARESFPEDAETAFDGSAQYFTLPGHNTSIGDCMPFEYGGEYHLFCLFDRRHHGSKKHLGAHQWAHLSTKDLHRWTLHPIALGIDAQWEGSICTGSMIEKDGRVYAFYAVRMSDGSPARLTWAESGDCVHFKKSGRYFELTAPYEPTSARDPKVWLGEDGLYHMMVTTSLADMEKRGGCLAHLVSENLIDWTQRARYVIDQVRGLIPWPVATMEISGKTFKVFRVEQTGRTTDKAPGTLLAVTKQGLEVACGDGSVLVVRELQAEGGKRMAAADYFRGHPIEI